VDISDVSATFETKRKGQNKPFTLTYTLDQAKLAGLIKPRSNWEKAPQDQLVARASSKLARLIYPDLLAGMYTAEELQSINEAE